VQTPESVARRKAEQRRSKRRSVYLIVKLVNDDGSEIGPCQVVDISGTGAHLRITESSAVPDQFWLFLATGGAVRRLCAVAWRSGNDVGVEFIASNGGRERRN
jgi:hypothetical protein